MKSKFIYKVILVFFLSSSLLSCSNQKMIIEKETNAILNLVLKTHDSVSLIIETYYNTNVKPIKNLEPYYRAYNSKENTAVHELFYKNIKNIISIEELDEMKTRYTSWSINKWEKTDLKNKKVKLISVDEIKKYDNEIPIVRLSEPLFTKDRRKAILKRESSKNGSGDKTLVILKKENGKWIIKGGIPIGTFHTRYH